MQSIHSHLKIQITNQLLRMLVKSQLGQLRLIDHHSDGHLLICINH